MSNLKLKGKNVALITPDMYDYPGEIIKAIEYYGAKVVFFRDRPQNASSRFLRNVTPQIHEKIRDAFLQNMLLKLRNETIDFVLLIKGTAITSDFLKQFKLEHPTTKIIMYQWDVDHIHPYLHLIDFVDSCFVFDANELPLHPKLKYLPLFFISSYKTLRDSNTEKDIDLLHIGTLHEGRYKQIIDIEKQLASSNLNIFIYLFLPFTGWVKELLKLKFYLRVKFKSLKQSDILALYRRSKAVLDIPQIGQLGLTMRTFEVLGAHKKLITTNATILKEKIYSNELVYVLKHDTRSIQDFLKSEIVVTAEMAESIEKYGIDNWVKQLFEISELFS